MGKVLKGILISVCFVFLSGCNRQQALKDYAYTLNNVHNIFLKSKCILRNQKAYH